MGVQAWQVTYGDNKLNRVFMGNHICDVVRKAEKKESIAKSTPITGLKLLTDAVE